jgi:hypothetical protein
MVLEMAVFVICYNLDGSVVALDDLIEQTIMDLSSKWWHRLASTWLVESSLSAMQIRDALGKKTGSTTQLLVVKCSDSACWHGFSDISGEWLQSNFEIALPSA